MATFSLWALDIDGEQACVIDSHNHWFLLSGHMGWKLIPLHDEQDAIRWASVHSGELRSEGYRSLKSIIETVRAEVRSKAGNFELLPLALSVQRWPDILFQPDDIWLLTDLPGEFFWSYLLELAVRFPLLFDDSSVEESERESGWGQFMRQAHTKRVAVDSEEAARELGHHGEGYERSTRFPDDFTAEEVAFARELYAFLAEDNQEDSGLTSRSLEQSRVVSALATILPWMLTSTDPLSTSQLTLPWLTLDETPFTQRSNRELVVGRPTPSREVKYPSVQPLEQIARAHSNLVGLEPTRWLHALISNREQAVHHLRTLYGNVLQLQKRRRKMAVNFLLGTQLPSQRETRVANVLRQNLNILIDLSPPKVDDS